MSTTFAETVRDRIVAAIDASDVEFEGIACLCGITAEQLDELLADPTPAARRPRRASLPARAAMNAADDPLVVSCPHCGVPAGWPCEAASGRAVGAHKARCVLAEQAREREPMAGAR